MNVASGAPPRNRKPLFSRIMVGPRCLSLPSKGQRNPPGKSGWGAVDPRDLLRALGLFAGGILPGLRQQLRLRWTSSGARRRHDRPPGFTMVSNFWSIRSRPPQISRSVGLGSRGTRPVVLRGGTQRSRGRSWVARLRFPLSAWHRPRLRGRAEWPEYHRRHATSRR